MWKVKKELMRLGKYVNTQWIFMHCGLSRRQIFHSAPIVDDCGVFGFVGFTGVSLALLGSLNPLLSCRKKERTMLQKSGS